MANLLAQQADLVITGAKIHTLDPARPHASAVAVRAGRILWTGDYASPYLGRQTKRIDAKGAVLVPGLIDSHCHMQSLGELLETHDFRGIHSVAEITKVIRADAARRPEGEWIIGRNWDQTNWGGEFPDAAQLTAAAPKHPVFLSRVDGHAAWVNRKALILAGINSSTPDPQGGRILRNGSGSPSGVLIDSAQDLVSSKIPAAGHEVIRRRLLRASRECVRLGITSVHDAGVGAAELEAYRSLIAARELPVRVYAMIGGPGDLWNEYLKKGPEIGERLTVRSIKLMADGAMGSRGAAFLHPYADDPGNSGLLMLTREQIEGVSRQAVRRGFQVNTHAIGDRANRTALQAYAAVLGGKNDKRFRVEHAQVIAPEDFDVFAAHSIIASMQPAHATSDMRWAEQRIGTARLKGAYAWRTLQAKKVPLASGSDFPVEEPNPMLGFYAAVARRDQKGQPEQGWFPEQSMSREEALRSWTLTGAYAAFEEGEKGSISPGKLADFVLLSGDILNSPVREILTTRVLLTVVGGEIVYSELR